MSPALNNNLLGGGAKRTHRLVHYKSKGRPMHFRNLQATSLFFFAILYAASVPLAPRPGSAQDGDLRALEGEWLFVEDRTEGRAVEKGGPPMSVKFALRVEKDAVIHVRSRGDERISLDGEVISKENDNGSVTRYSGVWKDGTLKYKLEMVRLSDNKLLFSIEREFRVTPDGLIVTRKSDGSVALYRHPKDIALPSAAKATISDLNWLAGAWVGKRRTSSIEERWSPPRGGAMLGVSRTVSESRGKMVAFEYLRIIERDGGLVYVAQPGGRSATEFVLTELNKQNAVFVNPRHDYPQRIIYELSKEGRLITSIGFAKGRLQHFEYEREDK